MEIQARALRIALEHLEALEQALDDAAIVSQSGHVEQLRRMLRRELTDRLHRTEMDLWTAAGMPEIPRYE